MTHWATQDRIQKKRDATERCSEIETELYEHLKDQIVSEREAALGRELATSQEMEAERWAELAAERRAELAVERADRAAELEAERRAELAAERDEL